MNSANTSGERQWHQISPLLCNIVLNVPTCAIRKAKETKSLQIAKQKENCLFLTI